MAEAERLTAETELAALHDRMRACRLCIEQGYNVAPGAVFSGPATARVMLVGQAPGITETEVGRPFNGSSGTRLFQWLAQAGWEEDVFRSTQYLSAVTKCYPGRAPGSKGDRAPTRAEQKLCAPFLAQELALVRPEILAPVGGLAVRRFLGRVRLSDVVGEVRRGGQQTSVGGQQTSVGGQQTSVGAGYWIVPLPHPSGVSLWLNQPENQARVERALDHLARLCRELNVS
ncbi:MAG TPA: hypothetical protein ENN19_14775 [Chloroflexi bacterium]|nr:hypothetical protein [Chloroflexota bacterium]